MKMAKASKEDLDMAFDLAGALDSLTQRWSPTMPEAIELTDNEDDHEDFDRDDDAQCGRALRHLLDIVERGSIFRVVMGLAVVLDPKNKCVDPDADTIEHHPELAKNAAEVERLQAERDALADSCAAKADSIDRLGETVQRLTADLRHLEEVNAGLMRANGNLAGKNCELHAEVERLRADPARVPLTDSQREALLFNMMLHGKMTKSTAQKIIALVLDGVILMRPGGREGGAA
jgi:hypothetical protein